MSKIRILTAPPLLTIQDYGRRGALAFGLCASGPMDQFAFDALDKVLATNASCGLEFAAGKLDLECSDGHADFAWSGEGFSCHINDKPIEKRILHELASGDRLTFLPDAVGNFGYLRFTENFRLPLVLGSRATNLMAKLGGLDGRNLMPDDELTLDTSNSLRQAKTTTMQESSSQKNTNTSSSKPFQFVWGLHQNLFENIMRQRFCEEPFKVSSSINRMGFRLEDQQRVFSGCEQLSLVSDPVIAGDIQILGNGTPIVLMRDHQPTGGYPRIATLLTAELSRFSQMPPESEIRFEPVSVARAHREMKSKR